MVRMVRMVRVHGKLLRQQRWHRRRPLRRQRARAAGPGREQELVRDARLDGGETARLGLAPGLAVAEEEVDLVEGEGATLVRVDLVEQLVD